MHYGQYEHRYSYQYIVMKIIYFHQHFTTPAIGGGTRSYEFAKKLIARGHQVTMVCGGDKSLFNLPPTSKKDIYRGNLDGIDLIQISIPYSNNDGLWKRTKSFLSYAVKGISLAMKEDYDLLFATSTPLTAGIPGIVQKLFRHKKFVFEVRDLWPELPKALGYKNPLGLLGMSLLEKWSYRSADACIGLSPGIKEGILRRSQAGKRVEMIPNGCDLDLFRPGSRENLSIDGVGPNDKVAIFTGAHGVANGLDSVLDAAAVLKHKGRNDIKLVFIGQGKMKPHLIDRKEKEGLDNCIFINQVPKTVLNNIVSSADMGLMVLANVPAFYYGTSPNKFFDYIASGLPIINNYPGWLADMIGADNCGIVVAPDSPEEFAEGLIKLADNPDARAEYGKNARALAEREFDRDVLSDKFSDFLEQVYTTSSSI